MYTQKKIYSDKGENAEDIMVLQSTYMCNPNTHQKSRIKKNKKKMTEREREKFREMK